jgi:hypothetical protein
LFLKIVLKLNIKERARVNFVHNVSALKNPGCVRGFHQQVSVNFQDVSLSL